jgi:hypothetical protein
MSTYNRWGRFHDTAVGNDLPTAARLAVRKCATRMLGGLEARMAEPGQSEAASAFGEDTVVSMGIDGIRDFAAELPSWAGRPDASWVASFNARCIEKFGNGGGNFRRLYAGFLEWAHDLDPQLVPADAAARCVRAADGWTAISECLGRASEEGAGPEGFQEASKRAAEVADIEQALFENLADRAG